MVDNPDAPLDGCAVRRGFTRIFWGLLFVALDIWLNHIDIILPDFAGYIIIVSGLGMVLPLHRRFVTARTLALIMIPLSLTDLIELQQPLHHRGEITYSDLVLTLLTITGMILGLLVVWYLCTGILEVAQSAGKRDLAAVARTRRNLYTVVSLVALALVIPGLPMPQAVAYVLIPLVILALIVMFLTMGLMLRASDQLADLGDPSHR